MTKDDLEAFLKGLGAREKTKEGKDLFEALRRAEKAGKVKVVWPSVDINGKEAPDGDELLP